MKGDMHKELYTAFDNISPSGFENQVAIVTGAAAGIGRAIAEEFHKRGCKVVIADIQHDVGQVTASEIGDNTVFIPCDISKAEQVENLINKTIFQFGRLDIMVNNAGVNSVLPEERVTVDSYPNRTWHKMIDVDLSGTFYCCKFAAKQMIKQRTGTIINIASVAGVVALRLQIGFVAAKAAVIKMTEVMACELAPFGIRVNAVSPGSTVTGITKKLFYEKKNSASENLAEKIVSFIPLRRPGEVAEIAGAVIFLASDSATYVNGHNIIVDGGWTSGFNRDF